LFQRNLILVMDSAGCKRTMFICHLSNKFHLVVFWLTIRLQLSRLLSANGEFHENVPSIECGIWLAPSTIPGAGIGMFAGRSFVQGEELMANGDSMVPIVDYLKHAAANENDYLDFLWTEYVWGSDGMLADKEGYYDVELASPGFGSAANSFIPIYNVDEWYIQKDTTGLHRSRDPGAGAFSAFHDRKSTARIPIASGEELYVTCEYCLLDSITFINCLRIYRISFSLFPLFSVS
jgi:hypothetical protein